MLFNLVLLRVCKHLLPLPYSYSLQVSAVLDHFGYPAPHLDQWQQRVWYNLGADQEGPHQMRTRLHKAFPQSSVLQGPSHLLPLAGQLQCRSTLVMGGNLLRPRKVRAQLLALRVPGPPRPLRLPLLKWR